MSEPESEEELIYEAAARWWQAVRGDAPYDADAFEAWIEEPRHAAALDHVKAAWDSFEDHGTEPELLALRSEVLNRVYRVGRRRWGGLSIDRRTLMIGTGIAAAAAVAVPVTTTWLMGRPRQVVTGIGEQRVLTLSDGSRVTVDANSMLKIAFGRDARLIDLVSGRAHFEVAKDPSRPFKVRAGDRTVTAIGTAFTVELRETKVSVTLFEGRIAVSDDTPNAVKKPPLEEIKPLEQVVMRDGDAALPAPAPVNPERALGWRDGKLFFDDEPLSEAAARMNDYSRVKITVTGPAAALRINGMFLAGQTGAFVEALESYYPVTAEYGADSVTIKSRS
ncbi:MAG TPA: FecR domain-containing protein [Asticcacaulis sp.]|nr:FecR domain-containing protein [Asticcacaulis sp.]